MKTNTFNILLVINLCLFLFMQSCYRCKDTTFCELPEVGERYFSNYKEGTYWIYLNQDSTKTDSVYVHNYEIRRMKDGLDECIEWDSQTFNIASEYISPPEISCGIGNPNCDRSYFIMSSNKIGVVIYSKTGTDTLFSYENSTDVYTIESYQPQNNGLVYTDVVNYNDLYWFAPEFGLIQYVAYNKEDTFHLSKFHIK